VTGGAGFIGSNLVRGLVADGWTVDVVDNMSTGHRANLDGLNVRTVPHFLLSQYNEKYSATRSHDTVLLIEADFQDEGVLERVAGGKYSTVFHLAAIPSITLSVERPNYTNDVNCTRTLTLLEAVRQSPTPVRFIFSSTCAVYGNTDVIPTPEGTAKCPASPYGLQKSFIEDYIKMACKTRGIDALSLRYYNVYGPNQYSGTEAYATVVSAWCYNVSKGLRLRMDGDGEQTRDMVFVGDVVRANILAAERAGKFEGETLNIGSGQSYSNNGILSLFREKFPDVEVHNAPARVGDIRHSQSDITLAREVLGYEPQTNLRDGLLMTWEWWGIGKGGAQ
jgi:UDP-glucose 4-epimerase